MTEKEGQCESGQLTRSALGRLAFIGELYNARTESFTSRSVLKSSFPKAAIQETNVSKTDYDYQFMENISDRFNMLRVEAELGLAFLFGLVATDGSGKFLQEESKSWRTVSCSLSCKIETVSQKLFVPFCELVQHLDLTAIEDSQNTHVVVEVNWGANCLLTLEASFQSEVEKRELEGALKGEISKIKSLLLGNAKGNVNMPNTTCKKCDNIKIKVNADVVPKSGWPTTIEGFSEFVLDVPHLLKGLNDGKGKPLKYVMIPVSDIQKATKLQIQTNVIVKTIQESVRLSIVFLFQDISNTMKKLYHFVEEMRKYKKYVEKGDLEEGKQQLESLQLKESNFKVRLSKIWVSVRSGEAPLEDMVSFVENFKNEELDLPEYESYLDSCELIDRKLSEVKMFSEKGVICLGRGDKIEDVFAQYINSEMIVFVTAPEFEDFHPDLYRDTFNYFLMLVTEQKTNTKYILFDLFFNPVSNKIQNKSLNIFKNEITGPRCFLLQGTEVLNSDLLAEYILEATTNFATLKHGEVVYTEHLPANRTVLEMVCPGYLSGNCLPDKVEWSCHRCKKNLEYGFDNFFYCPCGKGKVVDFEYRCTNPRHQSFSPANPEFLAKMLGKLRPLKEMNVLVIGQSGVGKSTWINSIINYLSYSSMDEAKKEKVIITIPITVTAYDSSTLQKHTVEMGSSDANEVRTVGDSSTQMPHTYSFVWQERTVRIIDTPGLGDTRGIKQDKENMKNIINHIGHLKELHGVCILLKANETRVTAAFRYCLKELLVHLHRKVARNIVFCFTNARISFYTPGQTAIILEKVISELKLSNELPLGKHNMFCLDNEAFLFLCTTNKTPITYADILVRSFSESWNISTEESTRLFETIKSFEPHNLQETLSLVTARSRILSMTKPIAEISKTIQINVSTMERKKAEIKQSHKTLTELLDKLNFDEIHLESEALKYPRTVCTSPGCVTYLSFREADVDVKEVEYTTHCHIECYLKNVVQKTVNNPELKHCQAMNGEGYCKNCGCGWQNHMHIQYSQKRVVKKAEDKNVKLNIEKEQSEKERIEEFVKKVEEKINQYNAEMEVIIQTSAKFGMFLRENAISFYNDAVADYLDYLITEEENKPEKSETEKMLIQQMKETLRCYEAEVKILRDAVDKIEGEAKSLTVQEVYQLEEDLYKLPLTGESLRQSAEFSRSSANSAAGYTESVIRINQASNDPKTKQEQYRSSKNKKSRGLFGTVINYVIGK